MKLYDEVITEFQHLLHTDGLKELKRKKVNWKDLGSENMIFRSDMAYELGGERFFKKSPLAVTEDSTLIPESKLFLLGPDLSDIKSDCSFSRVSLVRIKPENEELTGNNLYNAIKKIEFVRYHVSPEGYMMRVSSGKEEERARVSKEAIKNGLSFEIVGNMFLDKLCENQKVEACMMYFITDEHFDFDALNKLIQKSADITKAIDHIMKNVVMDCNVCQLQEVCDEVEGLKEMHFRKNEG